VKKSKITQNSLPVPSPEYEIYFARLLIMQIQSEDFKKLNLNLEKQETQDLIPVGQSCEVASFDF
jgi:hypothetical protein